MGGGLESLCLGRVYGADGAVLSQSIFCLTILTLQLFFR